MWILCGRQQILHIYTHIKVCICKHKTYVYLCFAEVLTATQWMLSIKGQVVVPPHPNFVTGMAVFFSSYYNFNLVYKKQAFCTLEFIQR